MKKNYKRYWQLLKEKGTLTLVFQKENYPAPWKEVSLWKAGLSRYKYLDYVYATKNPSTEISYEVSENSEEGTITLVANLRNKSYINPLNPKVDFSLEGQGESNE